MPVAFGGAVASYASTANVTTSGAVAASGSAASGSLLLVTVGGGGPSQTFTVADSIGNTYTSLPSFGPASGAAATAQFWYCRTSAAVAAGTTFTVTKGAAGGLAFTVDYWTGVDSTNPIANSSAQVTGASTTAGNAPTCSAALNVPAGGAIVSAGIDPDAAFTAKAGYTISQSANATGGSNARFIATQYQTFASASSDTPSMALSASKPWGIGAIALAPAAATGLSGTVAAVSGTKGNLAVPHPTFAIIGDSTTYRSGSDANPPSRQATTMALFLADHLFPQAGSGYWYGVGGKPLVGNDSAGKSAADCVNAAVAQLGYIDTLVIGLGTNDTALSDSAFTAGVNALMGVIGSNAGHVYWMNLAYYSAANTNAVHFNPLLSSALAGYGNATLLDWNTYIHGATYDAADWIYPTDSTHMTAQGWAKRDAFIAASVSRTLSGTAAATSGMSGKVTALRPISGTVTGTSATAGAVTARRTASGTVTATSGTSGAVTARRPVSGSTVATSTTTGALTATLVVSGTATATSGTSGNLSTPQEPVTPSPDRTYRVPAEPRVWKVPS